MAGLSARLRGVFGAARSSASGAWDLTALLSAADPKAGAAERHLWLIRFVEWLRHAPRRGEAAPAAEPGTAKRPLPVLRLRHALNVLERNEEPRRRVAALLARVWHETDMASLLADVGFSPRIDLFGELGERLRLRLLPRTPESADPADLFGLLFPRAEDAVWLAALDDATLDALTALVRDAPRDDPGRRADGATPTSTSTSTATGGAPGAVAERHDDADTESGMPAPGFTGLRADDATAAATAGHGWRQPLLDAIMYLASAIRAAGFSGALRRRMTAERLAGQPFRQLGRAVERVRDAADAGDTAALLREAHYLRALLDACQQAAASVTDHLEDYGVSVDLVFQVDQLTRRAHRLDELLTCALSPQPARETAQLLAGLVRVAHESRSVRSLFASHYSLLARKVAERSAERGEHYITRDPSEWRAMLGAAAGGGAVLGGTTLLKFVILGLGLSAFWSGLAAGVNYAASFVLIQLLHFTVATKQPAMTAPAMAHKLVGVSAGLAQAVPEHLLDASHRAADDAELSDFVDEVAHLIRTQLAGILGNLALAAPVVIAVQLGWQAAFGAPLVGHEAAVHTVEKLTLLGPTALYAAFTGVLLFASSLAAGWAENWFVWHRLDSALAWNPRIVARLGAARARRWGAWWRRNVSALASNVSLGLMLGLVPPVAAFFGLPLDVRHVTLSTGQLAAAVGSEGVSLLASAEFWWCVAGIAVTGALNLTVSFVLAFKVALRSRGIRTAGRGRIYAAIRRRMWREPLAFLLPGRI